MSTKKGGGGRAAVAYYRVSTREQGTSGLGLAAQRRAVESFVKAEGLRLADSFQDIESGKRDRRPGLEAALARAKALGAKLIIAKIDRLSRHAGFVLALRDSGVDFVAVDMPQANTLTIGIMALLAQQERELISTRTRAALAELKARGVKLGRNNLTPEARAKAYRTMRENALRFHNGAVKHAVSYREAGWTLAKIAEQLNASGSTTRRGKPFTPTTVRRLIAMARDEKARHGDGTAEDVADVERVFAAFRKAGRGRK